MKNEERVEVASDSIERVLEDAWKDPCNYFGFGDKLCDGCPPKSISHDCASSQRIDLVNRTRALFERQLPEHDTQAKIDADAAKKACEYFGWYQKPCDDDGGCPASSADEYCDVVMIRDLLRRQRELCAREVVE